VSRHLSLPSSRLLLCHTIDATFCRQVIVIHYCHQLLFPHGAIHNAAYTIAPCLSVCVLYRSSKLVFKLSHLLLASPFYFFRTKYYGEILTGFSLMAAASSAGSGKKKSRFSTSISIYFGNNTKQFHSYCETSVGTGMLPVEWCHFQWPRVTCNISLNITTFF